MLPYRKEDENTYTVRVEADYARENTNSEGRMEKKIKNTTKNKIEDLCSPLGGTHGYKDFLTYFHSGQDFYKVVYLIFCSIFIFDRREAPL